MASNAIDTRDFFSFVDEDVGINDAPRSIRFWQKRVCLAEHVKVELHVVEHPL